MRKIISATISYASISVWNGGGLEHDVQFHVGAELEPVAADSRVRRYGPDDRSGSEIRREGRGSRPRRQRSARGRHRLQSGRQRQLRRRRLHEPHRAPRGHYPLYVHCWKPRARVV